MWSKAGGLGAERGSESGPSTGAAGPGQASTCPIAGSGKPRGEWIVCASMTLAPRPRTSGAYRRRGPWAVGGLVSLLLLMPVPDRLEASRVSGAALDPSTLPSSGDDAAIDQFLQEFRPLRENSRQRHVLAAEVVTAATQNQLDPDLLFALVAVESSFNSTAMSHKGARGLGQLMFTTARAVAPTLVHRPADLDNVRRNLAVTARHLRDLLMERGGDLRATLTAYHLGRYHGHGRRRENDRYVGLICTYYASLKVRRGYTEMAATRAENAAAAES